MVIFMLLFCMAHWPGKGTRTLLLLKRSCKTDAATHL